MKNPRVRRPERAHRRVRRLRFPKLERRNHLFLQESSDDIRILLFTQRGAKRKFYIGANINCETVAAFYPCNLQGAWAAFSLKLNLRQ
jgi:hypothetical protein